MDRRVSKGHTIALPVLCSVLVKVGRGGEGRCFFKGDWGGGVSFFLLLFPPALNTNLFDCNVLSINKNEELQRFT